MYVEHRFRLPGLGHPPADSNPHVHRVLLSAVAEVRPHLLLVIGVKEVEHCVVRAQRQGRMVEHVVDNLLRAFALVHRDSLHQLEVLQVFGGVAQQQLQRAQRGPVEGVRAPRGHLYHRHHAVLLAHPRVPAVVVLQLVLVDSLTLRGGELRLGLGRRVLVPRGEDGHCKHAQKGKPGARVRARLDLPSQEVVLYEVRCVERPLDHGREPCQLVADAQRQHLPGAAARRLPTGPSVAPGHESPGLVALDEGGTVVRLHQPRGLYRLREEPALLRELDQLLHVLHHVVVLHLHVHAGIERPHEGS
eukprot:3469154-Pyramimonas_sp.AAC.4